MKEEEEEEEEGGVGPGGISLITKNQTKMHKTTEGE